MADSTLNRFLARGTNAQRLAFTPSPPTPASGPSPTYFWYETDTGDSYAWDGSAWDQLNAGGGGATVTSWKQSVRVATTAAGTLASSFENGDTVDGVTLATGNRILIKNQATASENGIYTVNASGAPTRATDADSGSEMLGAIIPVEEGTVNAERTFRCTNNATITLGSTNLTFIELQDIAAAGSQGDILYRGANGWARLAAGTSGQFLKTLGASSDPAWATPPGAMELISEVVTSSSQATVSFSSIATTWRDLIVIVRGRGTNAATNVEVRLQFNGDTAGNYDQCVQTNQGVPAITYATTSIWAGYLTGSTAPSNTPSSSVIEVPNYKGTTFNKTTLSQVGVQLSTTGTNIFSGHGYGQWRSTSAINAVLVLLSAGNFVDGSVVSLYGRM